MASGDMTVRYFRRYAALCPDADTLPYFKLCDRLRGACRNERSALRILAVHDTLRLLRASGNVDAADAVEAVYMVDGGRAPGKSVISSRVRRFAVSRNLDDRTVWRYIANAKRLYNSLTDTYGVKKQC